MKYIPVKIVHYTELKRGDLVSTLYWKLPSVEDVNSASVLEFIEVKNETQYFKPIINPKGYNGTFSLDSPMWTLLRIDGNGTGQRAESEHNEPICTISPSIINQPTNKGE